MFVCFLLLKSRLAYRKKRKIAQNTMCFTRSNKTTLVLQARTKFCEEKYERSVLYVKYMRMKGSFAIQQQSFSDSPRAPVYSVCRHLFFITTTTPKRI